MWRTFLCALCVLRVTPVRCVVRGSCPRKEPPPGVVVVSPGSGLVLTCSGHVILDGVKVVTHSAVSHSISHNAVLPEPHDTVHTGPTSLPSPPSPPSGVSQPIGAKTQFGAGDVDELKDESDDEEKDEKGAKVRVKWKWDNRDVQRSALQGSTLSLSQLRTSDSGRYSCHLGSSEKFSAKVIVAEAAETPHLSCYKKSPSSKIRCEWTPQTSAHKSTSCSLFIRKRPTGLFLRVLCSYSTRRSKCWCALDHNEEDKRTLHQAFLCVSSMTGNATSALVSFTPMHILKPDPPYNVSVQPETGLNRTLVVTWRPPYSWKFQDRFYELIYELRYKPLKSAHFQTNAIDEQTSRYTITDAEAGEPYEVQVRSRDEYEGQWSEWSEVQYGRSWTDVSNEDLLVTSFPYSYSEGSGSGDYDEDPPSSTHLEDAVLPHYLWITLSLGFCLTVSAVYIIRYKARCLSKLQSMCALAQCSDSVHPRPGPGPAVAEGHALLNKTRPGKEAKQRREQEVRAEDRTEAVNFNNTSYFLVQREI